MEAHDSLRPSRVADKVNHDFYAEFWDERNRINYRNRDKDLEKKINGIRIGSELTSRDWYSKLKEVSSFHLGTDDQRFKDACSEYIKGILVHTECSSVVKEDKNDRRKYFCGRCRKGHLDPDTDVRRVGVNSHLLNDEIYLGELFELIKKPSADLSYLPPYSFFLSIEFTLRKPFISKDDEEFYIHENPISKEKVFKVPYVRASSWKGNLGSAARKKLIDRLHSMTEEKKKKEKSMLMNERLALVRIFGNEKDIVETYLKKLFGELNEEYEKELRRIYGKKEDEEVNLQGRLHFYPTFFNMIGLDIINPHDRETRAGTKPIIMEVVPEDAEGIFSLLYVPSDMIEDENELRMQISEDLRIICGAIRDMSVTFGFSAKKTSGYGIINTKLKEGFLNMEGVDLENSEFKSFDGLSTIIESIARKMGETI